MKIFYSHHLPQVHIDALSSLYPPLTAEAHKNNPNDPASEDEHRLINMEFVDKPIYLRRLTLKTTAVTEEPFRHSSSKRRTITSYANAIVTDRQTRQSVTLYDIAILTVNDFIYSNGHLRIDQPPLPLASIIHGGITIAFLEPTTSPELLFHMHLNCTQSVIDGATGPPSEPAHYSIPYSLRQSYLTVKSQHFVEPQIIYSSNPHLRSYWEAVCKNGRYNTNQYKL